MNCKYWIWDSGDYCEDDSYLQVILKQAVELIHRYNNVLFFDLAVWIVVQDRVVLKLRRSSLPDNAKYRQGNDDHEEEILFFEAYKAVEAEHEHNPTEAKSNPDGWNPNRVSIREIGELVYDLVESEDGSWDIFKIICPIELDFQILHYLIDVMGKDLHQNDGVVEEEDAGVSAFEGVGLIETVVAHYVDQDLPMDEWYDERDYG